MSNRIVFFAALVLGASAMQTAFADAAQDGSSADPDSFKLVFATSRQVLGNFGGLQNGDFICQQLADRAGLAGRYKAWLSTGSFHPANRFRQATVPYVLTNGNTIADDFADLVDCPPGSPSCLQAPIDHDENGNPLPFNGLRRMAWTGTLSDGTRFDSANASCKSWTTTKQVLSGNPISTFGLAGDLDATSSAWTENDIRPCDVGLRLICFQQ